jgi:hypothetical protein
MIDRQDRDSRISAALLALRSQFQTTWPAPCRAVSSVS